MNEKPFPLDEYFARIGFTSSSSVSVEHLEQLQRAQVYSIPFENFDIQLGRGINLDADHLVSKLIRSNRGGYCFELNGLLLRAIQTIGFKARALLARVHMSGKPTGRGHQISLVTLDDKDWIVDVGFGGACPRVPIPLEYGLETVHDGTLYRLRRHELGYMLQQKLSGNWIDLYSFDLMPVVTNDIVYGNHFTSTHPASFFTTARVAVLCHPEGTTRLLDYSCTTTRNHKDTIEYLPDSEAYMAELKLRFGIELDASYKELIPVQTPN